MKKIFATLTTVALFAGALLASSANTTPANPFQDDLSRLDREFDGLNQLEQVVNDRNATYTELAAENNPLLNNVTNERDIAASLLGTAAPDGDRLLGIPGFLWGFCLGILGIILVYVAIDDPAAKKREGRQAIIGCAIWTVVWTVLYLLIWGAWAASG
jgi:hypothetical protein